MGTIVTIEVTRDSDDSAEAIDSAFDWFREIESRCTRYDPASELMQLCRQTGVAVPASPILFEALRFALDVAEETRGAFDPTIGHQMELGGFNREHRTREIVQSGITPAAGTSWRDIRLNPVAQTVTLRRPLLLDLGAVAKGLAIDAAARELGPLRDFAIDAGGDLFLAGRNRNGEHWTAGIRHPREDNEIVCRLKVSGKAVCTSGDYERPNHILNPRTGQPATACVSATVIADTAMLADSLATAAFILGPKDGIDFLHGVGVEGLVITPDLQQHQTKGFRGYVA